MVFLITVSGAFPLVVFTCPIVLSCVCSCCDPLVFPWLSCVPLVVQSAAWGCSPGRKPRGRVSGHPKTQGSRDCPKSAGEKLKAGVARPCLLNLTTIVSTTANP